VSWGGVVGQFFHTNFSYKYILVSGVNFAGAFGENIKKESKRNTISTTLHPRASSFLAFENLYLELKREIYCWVWIF